MFHVVLKSLKNDTERVVLDECDTLEKARQQKKMWRGVLGGKLWTVERRPDVDTLDFLVLKVEKQS